MRVRNINAALNILAAGHDRIAERVLARDLGRGGHQRALPLAALNGGARHALDRSGRLGQTDLTSLYPFSQQSDALRAPWDE